MKSIQIEKNKWEKINKIVLRVDNVDLIYKQDLTINFVCGFENISRGRCKLTLKEKSKDSKDNLFIHSDKALMEVNISYESIILEKVLNFISLKKNTLRKVKLTLKTKDSLMINNVGDLYVKDKTLIKIDEIIWNIPIL